MKEKANYPNKNKNNKKIDLFLAFRRKAKKPNNKTNNFNTYILSINHNLLGCSLRGHQKVS